MHTNVALNISQMFLQFVFYTSLNVNHFYYSTVKIQFCDGTFILCSSAPALWGVAASVQRIWQPNYIAFCFCSDLWYFMAKILLYSIYKSNFIFFKTCLWNFFIKFPRGSIFFKEICYFYVSCIKLFQVFLFLVRFWYCKQYYFQGLVVKILMYYVVINYYRVV